MRSLLFALLLTFSMAEELYIPSEEMETYECYAEYGMNCEEADIQEQEQYDQESEENGD